MYSILLDYGKSLYLNRICVEEPNLFSKNISIDDGAKLAVSAQCGLYFGLEHNLMLCLLFSFFEAIQYDTTQ